MIPQADRKKIKLIAKTLPLIYDTYVKEGMILRNKEVQLFYGHQIIEANPEYAEKNNLKPNKQYKMTVDKLKDHQKEMERLFEMGGWPVVGKYMAIVREEVKKQQENEAT